METASTAYGFILMFLVGVLITIVVFGYYVTKNLHKHVEKALANATTEEQEIIRNKVVKAVFPPRFDRS